MRGLAGSRAADLVVVRGERIAERAAKLFELLLHRRHRVVERDGIGRVLVNPPLATAARRAESCGGSPIFAASPFAHATSAVKTTRTSAGHAPRVSRMCEAIIARSRASSGAIP